VLAPPINSPKVESPPEVVDQVAAPKSIQNAADDIGWTHLAYTLGLQGLAQEIAVNSIVDSYDGSHLCLIMTPELKSLVNPDLESEIQQAVGAKLAVSCKLELASKVELDIETPHQARIRELEEDRQRAIGEIRESEIVKKLGRAFGAELVESSVIKLD